MKIKALPGALALTALAAFPGFAAEIYLVRHAEKEVDGSKDPALTEAGSQRASDLAALLKSAEIRRILSSDFVRTRETAAPTAEMAGLEIEIYDPKDLEPIAKHLLEVSDNALVVGHSDTTAELVDLMGGDGGTPIVEEWEYDRVYLVQTEAGRVTHTILLHLPPQECQAVLEFGQNVHRRGHSSECSIYSFHLAAQQWPKFNSLLHLDNRRGARRFTGATRTSWNTI